LTVEMPDGFVATIEPDQVTPVEPEEEQAAKKPASTYKYKVGDTIEVVAGETEAWKALKGVKGKVTSVTPGGLMNVQLDNGKGVVFYPHHLENIVPVPVQGSNVKILFPKESGYFGKIGIVVAVDPDGVLEIIFPDGHTLYKEPKNVSVVDEEEKPEEEEPKEATQYKVGDKVTITGPEDADYAGESGEVVQVVGEYVYVLMPDGETQAKHFMNISPAVAEEEKKPEKPPEAIHEPSSMLLPLPEGYEPPQPGEPDANSEGGFKVGTVREWKAGKFIKTSEGWLPYQLSLLAHDLHNPKAFEHLGKVYSSLLSDLAYMSVGGVHSAIDTLYNHALTLGTYLKQNTNKKDISQTLTDFYNNPHTTLDHYASSKEALNDLAATFALAANSIALGMEGKKAEESPKKKPKSAPKLAPKPVTKPTEAPFDAQKAFEEAKQKKIEELTAAGIPTSVSIQDKVQQLTKFREEFKTKSESGTLTDEELADGAKKAQDFHSEIGALNDKVKAYLGTKYSSQEADNEQQVAAQRLAEFQSSDDKALKAKKARSAIFHSLSAAEKVLGAVRTAEYVPKPVAPKPPVMPVPPDTNVRRGGIIINDEGKVLIVEPKGHFGGYKWTLPKGGIEGDETAEKAALREVLQETGYRCEVVSAVPGTFSQSGEDKPVGYFVMRALPNEKNPGQPHDPLHVNPEIGDVETAQVKWVDPEEALKHFAQNPSNLRARETAALNEAIRHYQKPVKFPEKIESLKKIRSLGGSTGARLVEDMATGTKYILKVEKQAGHIQEETHTDRVYTALGVRVPQSRVYETPEGNAKLSEYIEGVQLNVFLGQHPEEKETLKKKLQRAFVADALTANRDVLGADFDNILIDRNGEPVRIDNGGGLRKRAMGADKTDFDDYPMDLWTLRSDKNPKTNEFFGNMDFADIVTQIAETTTSEVEERVLKAVPDDLKQTMKRRISALRDVAHVGRDLLADDCASGYADSFTMHINGMGRAGVTGGLPDALSQSSPGSVSVKDEQGHQGDGLRTHSGKGPSVVTLFDQYLKDSVPGGSYEFVSNWFGSQAGNSWNNYAEAIKAVFSRIRAKGDPSKYFWKHGHDNAEASLKSNLGNVEKAAVDSLAAFHALNYEFLRTTDLPHSDRSRGVIRLFRTEATDAVKHALKADGSKLLGKKDKMSEKAGDLIGVPDCTLVRGVCESCSAFRPVYVCGKWLTEQVVPYHRIFGNYLFERYPGSGHCGMYGEGENEFMADLNGIPFTIVGSSDDSGSVKDMQASDNSLIETGKSHIYVGA